jgi:hypothetical protein
LILDLIVAIEVKAIAAIAMTTKEVSSLVPVDGSEMVFVSPVVGLLVVGPPLVGSVFWEKMLVGTVIEMELVVDNSLL